MEKPKNLYVRLIGMNWGRGMVDGEVVLVRGGKRGEKNGTTLIAQSIKYTKKSQSTSLTPKYEV